MKTTGIVLIVLGAIATIGAIGAASRGLRSNFSGLALIVLGAYLISRANANKEEEERKKKWGNGDSSK